MAEPSDVLRELHPERPFDREAVVAAVRTILEAIGEDPDRDGLQRTPERVADMYREIFAGIGHDPASELDVTFEADHDEMIMVRDIPLYSVCEHHLVPFIGRAHVAYIPNEQGDITGLSKLARLVDLLAKRPQVQERLTTQIADWLQTHLRPRGVGVVIEAEHLCMAVRGLRPGGTNTITSALLGALREDPRSRAEFLALTTTAPPTPSTPHGGPHG